MPPGVPADRLAVMRTALTATFADAEFKAEADKLGLIVNAPRSGQQLQSVIEQAYASPPRVVERLRELEKATEQEIVLIAEERMTVRWPSPFETAALRPPQDEVRASFTLARTLNATTRWARWRLRQWFTFGPDGDDVGAGLCDRLG